MIDLSPNDLRSLLEYDPDTGLFIWRPRTTTNHCKRGISSHEMVRAWNDQYSGVPALNSLFSGGYVGGSVYDQKCLAHRAAWAIVYGEWPQLIDHKNGDRADNRVSNLRLATPSENCMNRSIGANNSSGIKGVSWCNSNDVGALRLRLIAAQCILAILGIWMQRAMLIPLQAYHSMVILGGLHE